MVEFALVLVPLLLVLLGTIDWGYYLYVRAIVTDAARAGARAGSLRPTLALGQATAQSTATNFLRDLGIPSAGLTVSPCNGPLNSVCVQVNLTTTSITGFTGLGGVMPANASARASMRLEP